ncbi:hypothetical protein SINDD18_01895 [Streptococcus infantis]|uniref:Uncharacterized protein n=1 Tax=Streptococcus infantis TaxID=68892 RepID=A0A139RBF6_9STRE|nr:hypothetical protein SINDD18_01895 [Streptococcus infantis]
MLKNKDTLLVSNLKIIKFAAIKGACWWIDGEETMCSHCYYGWNGEIE